MLVLFYKSPHFLEPTRLFEGAQDLVKRAVPATGQRVGAGEPGEREETRNRGLFFRTTDR